MSIFAKLEVLMDCYLGNVASAPIEIGKTKAPFATNKTKAPFHVTKIKAPFDMNKINTSGEMRNFMAPVDISKIKIGPPHVKRDPNIRKLSVAIMSGMGTGMTFPVSQRQKVLDQMLVHEVMRPGSKLPSLVAAYPYYSKLSRSTIYLLNVIKFLDDLFAYMNNFTLTKEEEYMLLHMTISSTFH